MPVLKVPISGLGFRSLLSLKANSKASSYFSTTVTTCKEGTVNGHTKGDLFTLTTPIFYVNAPPHLGHLYTALLADAQARFRRLTGQPAFLSTGTDENGLKVQQAAAKDGLKEEEFCQKVSDKYRRLFDRCGIAHSDFVRTTEDRHARTVQEVWTKLMRNGHLKKDSYEGWYCVPDECFLAESQTQLAAENNSRISLESGHPVQWIKEDNYVFELGKFKAEITEWLDTGVIYPSLFRGSVSDALSGDNSLNKLSVSRPRSRLQWGIPVPDDHEQVIYVWLDALVNYLTVYNSKSASMDWPPDVHLIGKDIIKFHAVYWPAFLLAADLPLPKRIVVHSHWMVDNVKMSKSKGNIVDPNNLIDSFSSEGLRYFLLREGVLHSDGNYSEKKLVNYLNSELANTWGNLVSRCTAKTLKEVSEPVDRTTIQSHCSQQAVALLEQLERLASKVEVHYGDFNYYQGIDLVMEALRETNSYVQEEKPWDLKKSDPVRMSCVLAVAMDSLRICTLLLQPIVPQLCGRVLDKLNVQDRTWAAARTVDLRISSQQISDEKCVLFNRVKTS